MVSTSCVGATGAAAYVVVTYGALGAAGYGIIGAVGVYVFY